MLTFAPETPRSHCAAWPVEGSCTQRAHMTLGRHKRSSPTFSLPRERGQFSVHQVLAAPAGPERDRAIDEWCASVWDAFRDSTAEVADLLRQHGIG